MLTGMKRGLGMLVTLLQFQILLYYNLLLKVLIISPFLCSFLHTCFSMGQATPIMQHCLSFLSSTTMSGMLVVSACTVKSQPSIFVFHYTCLFMEFCTSVDWNRTGWFLSLPLAFG